MDGAAVFVRPSCVDPISVAPSRRSCMSFSSSRRRDLAASSTDALGLCKVDSSYADGDHKDGAGFSSCQVVAELRSAPGPMSSWAEDRSAAGELYRQQRLLESERAYRELLEREEDEAGESERAWTVLELAVVVLGLERFSEARDLLARAKELGDGDVARAVQYQAARLELTAGDPEKAIASLVEVASGGIDDDAGASALITLAEIERYRGNLREATSLLEIAVRSKAAGVANVAALFLADRVATQDAEAAIGALRRAMEKGDADTRARAASRLAPLLIEAGCFEEAIEPLSFAAASNDLEDAASAQVTLGQVHERLGNRPLARAALMTAAASGVPEYSAIARRLLFQYDLWDGSSTVFAPEVTALLRRRATLDEADVSARAALAAQAAALVNDEVDGPLAALLWRAGAIVVRGEWNAEEGLAVLRGAVDYALRAVQLEERLWGESDYKTADSHFWLSELRAFQLDHDPVVDPDDAIPIQERGVAALTAAVAHGGQPSRVGLIKNNLAMLYMSRAPEPDEDDVRRSVQLLEEAFDIYGDVYGESDPLVFNTLGSLIGARQKLHGDDAAEARRAAIVFAEGELEKAREKEVAREHLIPLIGVLGNLYQADESGDPGANMGRALELLREAVELTDERYGSSSANALIARMNLGTALRGEGSKLIEATVVLDDARRIGESLWGGAGAPLMVSLLGSLANAYGELAAETGDLDRLAKALDFHLAAREATQTWLGDTHTKMADALKDEALTLHQFAILHPRLAIRGDDAIPLLTEAADIQRTTGTSSADLAVVLGMIASAHVSTRSGDLDAASELGAEALRVLTPETAPRHAIHLAATLGLRFGDAGRWDDAKHFLSIAESSVVTLEASSVLMRSQSRDAFFGGSIAVHAAYAHALLGDDAEALICLERSRARWLRDALARDRAQLADLTAVAPEAAMSFKAAIEELQSIRRKELSSLGVITRLGPDLSSLGFVSDAPAGLYRAAAQAQRVFQDALAEVRAVDGFDGFLSTPSLTDLAGTLPRGWAAVYLAPALWGTAVLLLSPDGLVDGFRAQTTHAQLSRILGRDEESGLPIAGGYLQGQLGRRDELDRALVAAGKLVSEDVLEPLAQRLRQAGAEGVILVPCGGLVSLPLHGLAYQSDGRCLLDDLDVIFAPSLQILTELSRSRPEPQTGARRFVGVADATGQLGFASLEVATIARGFDAPVTLSTGTTREEVLKAMADADFVHFACHGQYEPEELLDSYLLLADGGRLRARDLLSKETPFSLLLIVASACQTAVTARLPDEALTLSAAFIYAGASAAIGTLWSVNDLSTALLMSRFYALLDTGQGGVSPWTALRHAQLWLRDASSSDVRQQLVSMMDHDVSISAKEKARFTRLLSDRGSKFTDPYYWAPFVCTGAPG